MVEIENTSTAKPPPYFEETPKRHDDYYFERGNFTVQVKDTLFKISDTVFWTRSDFFSIVARENGTTLSDIDNEKAQQPSKDEHRIWRLGDVEVMDFVRLLWVLDPPNPGECKAKTMEDWEGILKLADRWKFRSVCNLAIRKLATLVIDPVKKIEIMHRHRIRKEWVIDALVKLALQPEFPDIKETRIIGLEMVTELAKTREKVGCLLPPWNRGRVGPVKQVVYEVFKLVEELTEPCSWVT